MPNRFYITDVSLEPAIEFPYLNVVAAAKTQRQPWPIHIGSAVGLPEDIDALLVISDLQGQADPLLPGAGTCRLVGEYLPVFYEREASANNWPDPSRVGVILAGDLFALSDRRGGLGDTRAVWEAMARTFRWCVGVLGNHDLVGDKDARDVSGEVCQNAWVLKGDSFNAGDFVVGGVGGIIGRAEKPCRFSPEKFKSLIFDVVCESVDLLVLHEAPAIHDVPGRGSSQITETLVELDFQGTVICGHSVWQDWFHPRKDTFSVLNAEGRAVLLMRSGE